MTKSEWERIKIDVMRQRDFERELGDMDRQIKQFLHKYSKEIKKYNGKLNWIRSESMYEIVERSVLRNVEETRGIQL